MLGIAEEEIHRLWDDLSDLNVSNTAEAADWLTARLVELGPFYNATWAGAIRMDRNDLDDELRGWRVAASGALKPLALQSDAGHLAGVMKAWDRREIDPSFLLPLRDVGTFRAYSLRRGLSAEWFETPFYERHYRAFGVYDLVLIAFPLNEDCEVHYGFYSGVPIADETVALLSYALRGIKWFHRHLMLGHGLLAASSPLTPTEQKVLELLLTDAAEKRVADQMGLAESTTHQHVVAIYRKFGVRSRAALISLWLNRPG